MVITNTDSKLYLNFINHRLGLGHTENKNTPCLIEGIRDKKVVKMKSGFYHSVLLTEEKELYVFGRNAWVSSTRNTNMIRVN